MKNQPSQYPQFDHIELNTEIEFGNVSYKKLQPVKSGDIISLSKPAEGISNIHYNHKEVPKLSKILVVYFYSKHWGEVGLTHLKQLNAIRNEVKFNDGNIVIIAAEGEESALQQVLWDNNLSLPIHNDKNATLAKLFKVYSEESPAWNFYGGIDINVALPSIFVVDHYFKVVLDHVNEEITSNVPSEKIVSSVYHSNNYLAGRRSA